MPREGRGAEFGTYAKTQRRKDTKSSVQSEKTSCLCVFAYHFLSNGAEIFSCGVEFFSWEAEIFLLLNTKKQRNEEINTELKNFVSSFLRVPLIFVPSYFLMITWYDF